MVVLGLGCNPCIKAIGLCFIKPPSFLNVVESHFQEVIFEGKVVDYRHESLFVKVACEVLIKDHSSGGIGDITFAVVECYLRFLNKGHSDVLHRIICEVRALIEAKVRIVEEICRGPLH